MAGYDLDEPWNRQPCDDEGSWRAFQLYRGTPPPRSLKSLKQALQREGSRVELATLKSWAADGLWDARTCEYDNHLDKCVQKATDAILAEGAQARAARHLFSLQRLQKVGDQIVQNWIDRIEESGPAAMHELGPAVVVRMIKDAITLERLVQGESTENVAVKAEVDLSRLSVEELEMLSALQLKAGSGTD